MNFFPRGLFVNWDDIALLAQDSIQIIDIVLIGCKDQHSLKRFNDPQELYESCDIVIEMVDSGKINSYEENHQTWSLWNCNSRL